MREGSVAEADRFWHMLQYCSNGTGNLTNDNDGLSESANWMHCNPHLTACHWLTEHASLAMTLYLKAGPTIRAYWSSFSLSMMHRLSVSADSCKSGRLYLFVTLPWATNPSCTAKESSWGKLSSKIRLPFEKPAFVASRKNCRVMPQCNWLFFQKSMTRQR